MLLHFKFLFFAIFTLRLDSCACIWHFLKEEFLGDYTKYHWGLYYDSKIMGRRDSIWNLKKQIHQSSKVEKMASNNAIFWITLNYFKITLKFLTCEFKFGFKIQNASCASPNKYARNIWGSASDFIVWYIQKMNSNMHSISFRNSNLERKSS